MCVLELIVSFLSKRVKTPSKNICNFLGQQCLYMNFTLSFASTDCIIKILPSLKCTRNISNKDTTRRGIFCVVPKVIFCSPFYTLQLLYKYSSYFEAVKYICLLCMSLIIDPAVSGFLLFESRWKFEFILCVSVMFLYFLC